MTILVLILGAFFGGAVGESPFAALAGALLAWLVLRSRTQAQRLEQLKQEIETLRAQRTIVAAPPEPARQARSESVREPVREPRPEPRSEPIADTVPLPLRETTEPAEAAATAPAAAPKPAAAAQPARPARPPSPPPAPPQPTAWDHARDWLLGGNTIAKAGVGILFLGLAFLAKYASDHALLPVEFRLAAIAAVAIVLLVLGWRLRHRRAAYAQVLQGGAVAVLYLTLFVAFRFYGVLAPVPVFVLMVLVAALAAALAVLQDAPALAFIGATGGFATPLLVSSGSGNHVALFSYYLVLDLGIAAVAWFRTWRALNVVGFVFTFGVGTAWGLLSYRPEHYAVCQAFLVVYFLLFNAVLMMPARRVLSGTEPMQQLDRWVNGSLLFGLPTIGFVLQYGLVKDTAYGAAISALLLAAFYVGLARATKRHPALAAAFEGTLAVAIVFLSLVIPFALDARSTGGAWALEGAGLLWLGFRQQRMVPRAFGYALLLIAGAALVHTHAWADPPQHLLNAWFISALLLAIGAHVAAWVVQRAVGENAALQGEGLAEPLLLGWGTLWALAAAGFEIERFTAPQAGIAAWLAALSTIAALQVLAAWKLRWPRAGLPAVGHAPLLVLPLAAGALLLDSPAAHGGWWAWPLALAVHGFVLAKAAPAWPALLRHMGHALGALLLAALGALQGSAITRGWGDGARAWPWLGWLAVPALLLVLLPRPGVLARWPLREEPDAYRSVAAGVLAAGLLLWTLLANAFSNGGAAPLPHVPLLNPLDLGVGIVLAAVLAWLRSEGAAPLHRASPQAGTALLAGCAFVWLNAMLVRGFHHWAGVPYHFDDWSRSLAVQTGVTLLWSATALVLMWLSARRAWRGPWMAGAALLAAVVAKLLLVDLSGSGTVTRIVSFIGVGLLMLVIAYVAPLPSNPDATRQAR